MKMNKTEKDAQLQTELRSTLIQAIADFGDDNINSIDDALTLGSYSEHHLFESLIAIASDIEVSADVICHARLLGETFAGADYLIKSIQDVIDSENQLPPPPNEIWLDLDATSTTRYTVYYSNDSANILGGFSNLELAVNYAKNLHLVSQENVQVFKIDLSKSATAKQLLYSSEIIPN